jgi:hypothetical protein
MKPPIHFEHSYLCIGGPLDGQRRVSHGSDETVLRVSILKDAPLPVANWPAGAPINPDPIVNVEHIVYERHVLNANGEFITFWKRPSISNFDVFKALLEHYKPPADR